MKIGQKKGNFQNEEILKGKERNKMIEQTFREV